MLGRDPDVEGLIAKSPSLAPETRDRLRKLVRTFGATEPAALPFTELGPYTVLSRVGEGGMGMVYLAEHRFLERRVALKVIRPELAFSTVTRQRFHREALRIAKLRHQNIVSLYDAGEHEGVTYLAMEWVEGRGLDEVLRDARASGTRLDVTAAVRHARDIALALQCAHAAGIIHRDVKPANVRITPDGRALLLDFGLSLAEHSTSLSGLGQFVGTPQYASPEQIETGSAEIDPRTDVYSLGITLYECLTGEVPFTSPSLKQLFQEILSRDPVGPRQLDARVDEALERIVMRACAKRREDRFGSAAEMAEALEQWSRNSAAPAPEVRRKSAWIVWCAAAVVLVAAMAFGWRTLRRTNDGRAEASLSAQPVVRSAPRRSTALLGAPGTTFAERMNDWGPLFGRGTFGVDLDGPGIVGVCVDGITLEAHTLPQGTACIRGRLEPFASGPGARTSAAGVALELSNGRVVALLFVAGESDAYEPRLVELTRDGDSSWVRGAQIGSGKMTSSGGNVMNFAVSWNTTDTQFDWSDPRTPQRVDSLLVPRALRGTSSPARFFLVVEQGSARFEELVLEES